MPDNSYQLYHFTSCPYCIKARVQLKLLGVEIPLKHILRNPEYRKELIQGGGKAQVPCLRIENQDHEVQWMYESADIVDYFRKQLI